ncbi:hypothetical protein C8Q76DRAFT_617405 [Earliella scabrosa]|nr:hypothetical protein C8Q76DRAFT_617405 [Earliella scabrosa]
MFAKLAIYSVALFSVLAAATPVPGLCSTGALQCCNELKSVEEASEAGLLAGILVDVKDLTVPVGIDCSPITVVGLGGGTCSANAVCCQNNDRTPFPPITYRSAVRNTLCSPGASSSWRCRCGLRPRHHLSDVCSETQASPNASHLRERRRHLP